MSLPEIPVTSELFLQHIPLLDVRAPVEFNQGAFPGAVNLPLLDDAERQQIGTCYKQQGHDQAVELGHQLVSGEIREARVERWKQHVAANSDTVLYCFRGGLRSRISQEWLEEAGYPIPRIQGGYKAMRTFLLAQLEQLSWQLPFVVVAGRTGSGKTALLHRLPVCIDLEALAHHRGSSFGRLLDPQPTNIDFENALSVELMSLQADRHLTSIYIEDEGKMIGSVHLPESLRKRLPTLPAVVLEATDHQRVELSRVVYIEDLLQSYQQRHGNDNGFDHFAEHHRDSLARIAKRFGSERHRHALALFDDAYNQHRRTGSTEVYDDYLRLLLLKYYDPMYDYQMKKKHRDILFRGDADAIVDWADRQQPRTESK